MLIAGLLGGVLVGCGGATAGQSRLSASAAARSSGIHVGPATVADLVALGDQIFPAGPDETSQSGGTAYNSCGPFTNYPPCPLTPRLQARLQQIKYWLCRGCGTGAISRNITATPTATGGMVHSAMGTRDGTAESFDLIVVNQGGQLLVDDELCAGGGPDTSIYKDPVIPRDVWGCTGS